MASLKDRVKMALWRFGLRGTIPSSIVNAVLIEENHEPLVDIRQDETLHFSEDLLQKPCVFLRKSAYQNIKKAQKKLPPTYFFKIYSAFRSLEEQKCLWKKNYKIVKEKYPALPQEEIEKRTKAVCANPRFGFGGHQTGGAVDMALCDASGKDYDLGTIYGAVNAKTPTKAKGLNAEQQKNRNILKTSMESVGFKNYPNEWWHFCYGDRMWGAYLRKKSCFYGMPDIEPDVWQCDKDK